MKNKINIKNEYINFLKEKNIFPDNSNYSLIDINQYPKYSKEFKKFFNTKNIISDCFFEKNCFLSDQKLKINSEFIQLQMMKNPKEVYSFLTGFYFGKYDSFELKKVACFLKSNDNLLFKFLTKNANFEILEIDAIMDMFSQKEFKQMVAVKYLNLKNNALSSQSTILDYANNHPNYFEKIFLETILPDFFSKYHFQEEKFFQLHEKMTLSMSINIKELFIYIKPSIHSNAFKNILEKTLFSFFKLDEDVIEKMTKNESFILNFSIGYKRDDDIHKKFDFFFKNFIKEFIEHFNQDIYDFNQEINQNAEKLGKNIYQKLKTKLEKQEILDTMMIDNHQSNSKRPKI